MTLSEKRRMAIYGAVHEPLMDVRIAISQLLRKERRHDLEEKIDTMLFGAQTKAASAAVAEVERRTSW